MTHNILPIDIELATRLLAAGSPDDAVITTLGYRGIDSAAAAQLVEDLRNGRRVTSQLPPGLEITPRRRSRSNRDARPPDAPGVSSAPEPSVRRQGSGRRRSESRKGFPSMWLIIPVAVLWVLSSGRLSGTTTVALPTSRTPTASKARPPAGAQFHRPIRAQSRRAPSRRILPAPPDLRL